MVIMYKMTPEKKEKYAHKIEKMMDFLEEFKECLDESEYSEDMPEYRGGGRSYRKEYDEDEMRMEGRYGYRRGGRRM